MIFIVGAQPMHIDLKIGTPGRPLAPNSGGITSPHEVKIGTPGRPLTPNSGGITFRAESENPPGIEG